ncbi:hypothetical protein CANCADRAFT_32726 [Tortispora caseinolytica NRRL Y-17796]|uniref:Septin-type G domain-containing protein n=1 Tax=Tortispora caseinolytica NRRL Y-17796 TaxID=767744 RepID=A0A1E4TCJ7_9ASCO|nr:hypothetical protein CANCADRAFT_32726 [Tortispora caseinolytica NRRL Y-17796]
MYTQRPPTATSFNSSRSPSSPSPSASPIPSSFPSFSDCSDSLGWSFALVSAPADSEGSVDLAPVHSGSTPDLVMPTLPVHSASLKPFTELGRKLTKLKVLVVGAPCSGKTALVHAILRTSPHIVYFDPSDLRSTAKDGSLSEVQASTRPYPCWWSCGYSNQSYNSTSTVDNDNKPVLDRNLCLVDPSSSCTVDDVLSYLNFQFERTAAAVNIDPSLVSNAMTVIAAPGLPHVDLCLYTFADSPNEADTEYISSLSKFVPVVPILTKSDTYESVESLLDAKCNLVHALDDAPVFWFNDNPSTVLQKLESNGPRGSLPFAVSAMVDPLIEMDASVLMASGYNPLDAATRLVDSDLDEFYNRVFLEDTASWFRHLSAQRFLEWRSDRIISGTLCSAQLVVSHGVHGVHMSPYLDSIVDRSRLQEKLMQAELAQWVRQLEQSVRLERRRNSSNSLDPNDLRMLTANYSINKSEEMPMIVRPDGKIYVVDSAEFKNECKTIQQYTTLPPPAVHCRDPLNLEDILLNAETLGWRLAGTLVGASAITGCLLGSWRMLYLLGGGWEALV